MQWNICYYIFDFCIFVFVVYVIFFFLLSSCCLSVASALLFSSLNEVGEWGFKNVGSGSRYLLVGYISPKVHRGSFTSWNVEADSKMSQPYSLETIFNTSFNKVRMFGWSKCCIDSASKTKNSWCKKKNKLELKNKAGFFFSFFPTTILILNQIVFLS